jgi:DNA-directed RNA polymerase specialized sigma24 family protein
MDTRLSRLTTLWTLVSRANDEDSQARAAQQALLERYGGGIRRYLVASLRDADAADELYQEFAFRFVRGGLRGADRSRGRFRDYVKGVLFHLVADHFKKQQRQPRQLHPDHPEPAEESPPGGEDEAFLASWREDLLARTWGALEEHEKGTGQVYFTVLRFRADHPDLPSHQMAERLGPVLGKELTAAGVRKTLERAREKFADLLLEEIAQSLNDPTREALEGELIDLGLLGHCREALERRAE